MYLRTSAPSRVFMRQIPLRFQCIHHLYVFFDFSSRSLISLVFELLHRKPTVLLFAASSHTIFFSSLTLWDTRSPKLVETLGYRDDVTCES